MDFTWSIARCVFACACVGMVTAGAQGGVCPGEGDCCEANGSPGCDDADCCDAVCSADSFCCDVSWDGVCADMALDLCPDLCTSFGACCLPDETCLEGVTEDECSEEGGEFQGEGTACADVVCLLPACGVPGTGGCGVANGTPFCDDTIDGEPVPGCCDAVCAIDPFCCDTSWDAICADETMKVAACGGDPSQLGACCLPDGTCVLASPDVCGVNPPFPDGVFQGVGTDCEDPDTCKDTGGACCLPDGSCVDVGSIAECNDMDGLYLGVDTTCEDANCPSPVECPKDSEDEGEPCGQSPDVVNGGCNSTPNVFTDVACGDVICGTAYAEGGTRDTDWYQITVEEETGITVILEAEFSPLFATITGVCDMPVTDLDGSASGIIQTTLPPGTTTFFVSTSGFEGVPCGSGSNEYVLSFVCGAFCADISECPDVDGSGSVDSGDLNAVLGGFGCVAGEDVICEGDVNCDGATDSGDLNAVLGTFADTCEEPPPPDPCNKDAGDCCAPNGSVGCDQIECCESVCAADPFCCETEWDQLCADAAADDPNCDCP